MHEPSQVVNRKTKPPKSKEEKLEEIAKISPQERIQQKMHDCLKEAQVARTNGVALRGLEFADKLSKKIINHVDSVEELFSKVENAVKTGGSLKSPGG